MWNFRNWSRVRRLSASKVQAVSLPYCLRDKFGFCYTSWFIIETIGKIIFNLTWNFWVGSEQDCEPNTWRKITKDLSSEEDVLQFKWTRFTLLARSMLRRSFVTCLINTNDSDVVCEHLGLVLSQITITSFLSSII